MSTAPWLVLAAPLLLLAGCTGDDDTTDTADTADTADTSDTGDTGQPPAFAGLDRYVPAGEPFEVEAVVRNLSGITWDGDTGTFFLVKDSGSVLFEYADDLSTLLREIRLEDAEEHDNEGIAWLGGEVFAVTNEGNKPVILSIPADGSTAVDADPASPGVQELEFPPAPERNKGLEGICYDPSQERLYAVQELEPMVVYALDRPEGSEDLTWTDGSLVLEEPFDAEEALAGVVTDLAGCAWNPLADRLLLVSHESSVLLDVSTDGQVHGSLELEGALKFEGVTLLPDGRIVVVSEPDTVRIYEVGTPPS